MLRDIEPAWGSHARLLESALQTLPDGALVIEHGAGVYSTPLIARFDVRVVCIEECIGWRSWAAWLYADKADTLQRAKAAIPLLEQAGLVFIDGAARERGDLLKWALERSVPLIVAHDTEGDARNIYGYQAHSFSAKGYDVAHDGERPQTTMWGLR